MSVTVFKHTSDDWHPSFKVNGWAQELVKVSLHGPSWSNSRDWIVLAEGGDNFGMVRIFLTETAARDCFDSILHLKDVTKQSLVCRGFMDN